MQERNSVEKYGIIVFILALVIVVVVLIIVPLNNDSKDAVLMIVGSLTSIATTILPKLLTREQEIKQLKRQIEQLESQIEKNRKIRENLEKNKQDLMELIVDKHLNKENKND